MPEKISMLIFQDGMTVHLVIKQGGAASAAPAAPSPTPAPAPPTRCPSHPTTFSEVTFFLSSGNSGAPPPDPAQSPFGLGGFGGIPGMGNLGTSHS